tara:strand:- start:759 stop:1166 length:408 start_codon:yes stop_codon:yes gene_type:complete
MNSNQKTKVIARSTYGDRFFEFVVAGKKESLEDIMRALAAERKHAGYTGEMLTDLMYTNFVLIYSCSPCNVTPVNIPASSYTFDKIKHYEVSDDDDDSAGLAVYTFDICLRGEGANEQEAWENAVTAFCLDPGCP